MEKKWDCRKCGCAVMVPADYEPQGCCSGVECGCYGLEINPVFCERCDKEIYGPPADYEPMPAEAEEELFKPTGEE